MADNASGAGFPREGGLVLALDGDGHADVGEMLFQGDDVLVEQADAALAGTARHGVLVVGTAMDADTLVTGRGKAQEPVPIGQDVAAAVLEVVPPCGCVLYHGDLEGLAGRRLGGAHVASLDLVALVLAHAAGELGHEHGVAVTVAVIHAQSHVALGDDDKGGAARFGWGLG